MDLFSFGNKPILLVEKMAESLVKIADILERLEKHLDANAEKDN